MIMIAADGDFSLFDWLTAAASDSPPKRALRIQTIIFMLTSGWFLFIIAGLGVECKGGRWI